MTPAIAVVVLNWNKAALTRQCFDRVKAVLDEPTLLVCVDNGSEEPLWLDPDIMVIRNAENRGFAGGVNDGLRHAFDHGAEFVWLLNNDATPLPGALQALVSAARADPRIGLASPVILDSGRDNAVDFHGGRWDALGESRTTDAAEYAAWAAETPERIWLLGTALLVTRRLVDTIGYFDEGLFAYWEDNDISRRSAAAGFRNVVVPEARVAHACDRAISGTTARAPYYFYYMARNEILVLARNATARRRWRPIYWAVRRSLRSWPALAGFPAQRRAMLRGLADGLLGRRGPMPR